ncbi:MAG TPA: MarR family transcriptional regulator [Bacillales bacterium]|nr:MarR family transcriptional regulator [Bacillales bacterium]
MNKNNFDQNMGHWVKRLDHAITNKLNDILRSYGLARSQWEVLFKIMHLDEPTQKELQNSMGVESGTLTGIIDSLVRKNWVTRLEHPKDRRVKVLEITEEGRERWAVMPNPIFVGREQMMKGINREEEQFVIKVIKKALNNLESEKQK